MHIKSFHLLKYGPIMDINIELQDGLNIIYGPNGSGKTLILEAIQKMLIGKRNANKFKSFLKDYPVGEVTLDNEGKTIVFDGKTDIGGCSDIVCEDLDNIFLIKDGNLKIENEKEFYQDIIPRLIGIDLSQIDIIKDKLLIQGRMASPGNLLDNKKNFKPKTQLKKAFALESEINDFLESEIVKEEKEYLFKISRLKNKKKQTKTQILELEEAKNVQEVKKLEIQLNTYLENSNELREREKFKDEYLKLEDGIKLFNSSKRSIDDYKSEKAVAQIFTALFFILASISLLGLLNNPSFIIFNITSVFSILALFICMYMIMSRFTRLRSRIKLREDIFYKSRKHNINYENLEQISDFLKSYFEEVESLKKNLLESKGALLYSNLFQGEDFKDSNLNKLEEIINRRKSELNMKLSIKYDEFEHKKQKSLADELENTIEEMKAENESFKNNFLKIQGSCKDLQQNLENISDISFDKDIQNIESLKSYLDWLRKIIKIIETDMQINEFAYNIFDKIFKQETEKIAQYFNESTDISEFINNITDGLFKAVEYEASTGTFQIHRSSDIIQTVNQISQGELSQLYFAIRLSLGRKCLDKGFLLMEDPFMASDEERIEQQITLLEKFLNNGWQAIVLTAQTEIKEMLKEKGGKIAQELQRII